MNTVPVNDFSNNFYTSDLHFNHENVIKFCERPFTTVEEMEEGLIEIWNRQTDSGSTVYHLGDFTFLGPASIEKVYNIVKRLNGQIKLILGNHDNPKMWKKLFATYPEMQEKIEILGELKYVRLDKHRKIVMCHYPMISWRNKDHGVWHLYGHMHGSLGVSEGKSLDVGIDNHPEFKLFTHAELENHFSKINQDAGKYSDYHGSK